jgi:uncharacterized protein (TIGR02996 family)
VEDAFIRTIAEESDDLLPRRAYADWLMEQSDPAAQEHGEFISLQIELAEGVASRARRRQLRQREAELLARHGEQWAGAVRPLVRKYTFRRGMVESVILDPVYFVLDGAQLFQLAPVTEVAFALLDNTTANDVARCPHLSRVRALDLSRATVGPTELRALLGSPFLARLERLDLTNAPLGNEGAVHLASGPLFPQLTHLNLARTGLTPHGARALLHAALQAKDSRLRVANLRGNRNFGFADAEALVNDPALSAEQRRRALQLLAPVIERAPLERARELMQSLANHPLRLAPQGLMHPWQRVRQMTMSMLATDSVRGDVSLLPALLQRRFEKNQRDNAVSVFQRLGPHLPRDLRWWLESLGTFPDSAETSLKRALCSPRAELPPHVHAEFAALCQRRLNWRASHGRAAPAPAVPANATTDRVALWELASLVLHHAEAAGLRHARERLSCGDRIALERPARHREAAWLCRWLMELLLRAPDGELSVKE